MISMVDKGLTYLILELYRRLWKKMSLPLTFIASVTVLLIRLSSDFVDSCLI